jgi:hypothetical protein
MARYEVVRAGAGTIRNLALDGYEAAAAEPYVPPSSGERSADEDLDQERRALEEDHEK